MQYESVKDYERAFVLSQAAMRVHVQTWLKAVCDISGEKPTQVARRAGLSTGAITNFMFQVQPTHFPSMATLLRISEATGVPLSQSLLHQKGPFYLSVNRGRPPGKVKTPPHRPQAESDDSLPLFRSRRERRVFEMS